MMSIDQLAETRVVAQLREVADRIVEDAEGMFEARVSGSGIDGRSEPQLRDVAQSLKLSGIDERSDARGEVTSCSIGMRMMPRLAARLANSGRSLKGGHYNFIAFYNTWPGNEEEIICMVFLIAEKIF